MNEDDSQRIMAMNHQSLIMNDEWLDMKNEYSYYYHW